MIKIKVVGTGAAGINAVIDAVEEGVLSIEDTLLLNTTPRDVPAKYKKTAHIFGNIEGCGKERHISYDELSRQISEGFDCLDTLIDVDTQLVVVVTSLEGGTGSGSVNLLEEYYRSVYGVPVCIIGFTGFENEARGLANTVDFFKELSPFVGLQLISNKKFLREARGNKSRAEEFANKEFVSRICIMQGITIFESRKNIDRTDLLKTVTAPGYMTIETCRLPVHIKSVEDTNNSIIECINNTKSIEFDGKKSTRRAVIVSCSPKTQDYIDIDFDVISELTGDAFEKYIHIQDPDDESKIEMICSGMRIPAAEVAAIQTEFMDKLKNIDLDEDDFFSAKESLSTDSSRFNSAQKTRGNNNIVTPDRSAFISKLDKKEQSEGKSLDDLKASFLTKANKTNQNY